MNLKLLFIAVFASLLTPSCGPDFSGETNLFGIRDGNGGDIIVCDKPNKKLAAIATETAVRDDVRAALVDYHEVQQIEIKLRKGRLPENGTLSAVARFPSKNIDMSKELAILNATYGAKYLQDLRTKEGDHEAELEPFESDKVGKEQLLVAAHGASLILDRIMNIDPIRAARLKKHAKNFVNQTVINYQRWINNQPDLVSANLPAADCAPQQIAVHLPNSYGGTKPFEKEFYIAQKFWDLLSWTSRIGLVLHELVYRDVRDLEGTKYEHRTSAHIRVYNKFLALGVFNLLEDDELIQRQIDYGILVWRRLDIPAVIKVNEAYLDLGTLSCEPNFATDGQYREGAKHRCGLFHS